MGTYLSSPIVEKGTDEGECLDDTVSPLVWGVVDMQGWRKTMEDAHVAQTNLELKWDTTTKAKVFGVFDGHGGPEVARFCQLYLIHVLEQQPSWKEQTTLETPELVDYENQEPLDAEQTTTTTTTSTATKPSTTDPGKTAIGQALIHAFHALDRMIDDRARRDELIRLRTSKPKPEERRTTDFIPPPLPHPALQQHQHQHQQHAKSPNTKDTRPENAVIDETVDQTAETMEEKSKNPNGTNSASSSTPSAADPAVEDDDAQPHHPHPNDETTNSMVPKQLPEDPPPDAPPPNKNNDPQQSKTTGVGAEQLVGVDNGTTTSPNGDDDEDSTEAVGKGDDGKDGTAGKESSKVVVVNNKPKEVVAPHPPAHSPALGMVATIIQNGRQICNLPDHPIHAGCTAIVAVLIGRTLTIANAGDSRAVLCRAGGRAEALSIDHKPHQDREMSRITKAGGFVNQFGRVNGNLNLSRSIGDLKYKQIPGLTPAEQMITADPDIVQVTLDPQDEFIILGCDGIWDCLSNDQAVKYVRDRIDTKSPIEIGIEMLDEIISEDPRATQGIGGDNMTVMVIDLQPSTRSYR